MPAKRPNIPALATRIRQWLAGRQSEVITVPEVQRGVGGERHEIEQAFHQLNLAGVLSRAGAPAKTYCCGDCRAARYRVIKQDMPGDAR